jgi:hypothetical protein
MAAAKDDEDRIHALLAPLVGIPAWGCKLGVGSFVTLEFGPAQPATGEAIHGTWHLWLYGCAWRLEHDQDVLAGSDDERDVMEVAINALDGLVLQEIRVRAPALDATWTFENGYQLQLFPMSAQQGEHWLIFLPDGNVLNIGPGNSWSVEPADVRNDA